MPEQDPEPESYSLDEMMNRLRDRGRGSGDDEGELVTREDGTQVYKVRKRKRRSQQLKREKEKREKKVKTTQVVAAIGILAGAGLALVGSMVYLNSPIYQNKVTERISEWTGAEVKLSQFRASPLSAGASQAVLQWPENSFLNRLTVNSVRADLNPAPLLLGKWKGSEMLAEWGGSLVLRLPSETSTLPERPGGAPPFRFRYRAPKFGVVVGDPESPVAHLTDTEGSLDILDPVAGTSNLRFEGGILNLKGWGGFALKLASLQYQDSGLRVGSIRVAPATLSGAPRKDGELEIINPGNVSLDLSEASSLNVRLTRMPVESLLGTGYGKWLTAEVETPDSEDGGNAVIQLGGSEGLSCRIPFRSTTASVATWRQMPVFAAIAAVTGEVWYQQPAFDFETSGVLVRKGAWAGLEDIRLASRSRMIVTGNFGITEDGKLEGTLRVGLPEALVNLQSAPGFKSVFKQLEAGHLWAVVKLSGTGMHPEDDFEEQLKAAAANLGGSPAGDSELDEAFEELIGPER